MVKLSEKYCYKNNNAIILFFALLFVFTNSFANTPNDSILFKLPKTQIETFMFPLGINRGYVNIAIKLNGRKIGDGGLDFFYFKQHYYLNNVGVASIYAIYPGLNFAYQLYHKKTSIYLWGGLSCLNEMDAFSYSPPVESDHETVWVPYEYHYRAISLPLGIQFLFRSKNHKKRFTSLMLGLYSDFSFYKHLTEDEIYYHYDVHWGGGDTLHDTLQTVEQTTHHVQFSRLSAYVGVGKQYFVGSHWSLSWQISAFEPFYFRKFLFDVHYFKLGAQFGVGYTLK